MGQRVQDMASDEIIDESTVKKEVEEAKKELKEEIKEEKNAKDKKGEKAVDKKKKDDQPKHSKRYFDLKKKIEDKIFPLEEAIELVLETANTKFDSTIELHSRLLLSGIRGMVVLPAGTPKQKKILEVTADNIADLSAKVKAGKFDFDMLITKPEMMPKIAPLAKILGPKGLMPTPKSGTVVEDTKAAIEEIKSGKVEYKQDDQKNIHLPIGKASWGKDKIRENAEAVIKILPKNKVASIHLTSTMGPSVKVELPK
jgi:large subunit ribosomal protein L1